METLFSAILILSVVVRYGMGCPAPHWVQTWIDRLWLLLGLTWVVGIVWGFFTATTKTLPNGGYSYVLSAPKEVQYFITAIFIPISAIAVLGALHVGRAHLETIYRNYDSKEGGWRDRFVKLNISLIAALAAIIASWLWGGPLIMTSGEGYSNVSPFIVDLISACVFLAALGWGWRAVKATPKE